MILHFPIYVNLKFPGNALSYNEAILSIAKFELIDTVEKIDRHIFFLPESEAYNDGFQTCGYLSSLLVKNISMVVWMYALHIFCSILFACCYCLSTK